MDKRRLWIIISAVVVLAIIIGFVWLRSSDGRDLDISFINPTNVLIGVPLTVSVNIVNNAGNVLEDTQLALNLPENIIFLGSPTGKRTETRNLGNLGGGTLLKEDFQLLVLNDESSIKKLEAVVTYIPNAISSRFEKIATTDLAIREYGVALDLAAPVKVFNGEEFELRVSYRNVSTIDFQNLQLTINYPPTFNFKSSSIKPDVGDNTWDLGGLRSSSEMEFTIRGSIIGPADAFFDFPAIMEAEFFGRNYEIANKSASLAIAPSPLSLSINLNGDVNDIIYPNTSLTYTLNYANNTDVGLKDVIIKAKLDGGILNLATLETNGSLRSSDNTIIWNASDIPSLASLSPGASGSVIFRLQSGNYPIRRLSDKNFTVKVTGEIESPTVPFFVESQKTIGATVLENKVGGQLKVDTRALFRDAASGILNAGSLPPKVGQPTEYTIHWLVSSYSTDLQNVEIKAFLGGNVRFTGVVKSDISSQPTYNERTQEVTWFIDKINANKGVLDKPIEAIFQIEATPAIDVVNRYMTLIQKTSAQATDNFTGAEIEAGDLSVTTQLTDDPTVTSSQGVVTQ